MNQARSAYAARMRVRFILTLVAFALLGAAAAAYLSQRGRSVLVQESGAPKGTSAPGPCPKGTLEDDGVCVPVPPPRPASSAAADSVPKLPERPLSLDAYQLPALGTPSLDSLPGALAKVVLPAQPARDTWPAAFELPTPALLITTSPGTPVSHLLQPPNSDAHEGRVLAAGASGQWLLLGHELTRAGHTLRYLALYAGLADSKVASANLALSAVKPGIGKTAAATLVIAFRQLRPGNSFEPNLSSWSAESSVGMDPRNVLPLK